MKQHIQTKLKTKQKIERDKETVRPTVINDVLIQQYMVEYNRENKIFDDDERQIWELTHLSLSFKSRWERLIWKLALPKENFYGSIVTAQCVLTSLFIDSV